MRRQSAGAGAGAWLGAAAAAGAVSSGFGGGKIGHFGRCILDQEREKKMRGDPRSGEPRIFGGQPVEAQDRFQSFEGQFDIPLTLPLII